MPHQEGNDIIAQTTKIFGFLSSNQMPHAPRTPSAVGKERLGLPILAGIMELEHQPGWCILHFRDFSPPFACLLTQLGAQWVGWEFGNSALGGIVSSDPIPPVYRCVQGQA